MPDKDEVQPVAEETLAPPTPTPSDESVGAGSAGPDVSELERRLASYEEKIKVLDTLDEKIDARFKSAKDRRFAKVEEIYAWVQASGGDVTKIKGDLEISEHREELQSIRSQKDGSPSGDPQAEMTTATVDILDRHGIQYNDPEYLQFVARIPSQSVSAWKNTLGTWAQDHASKKAKQGGISTATAAGVSGSSSTLGDAEALIQELADYNAGKHGSLSDSKNIKRYREIKAQLDKTSPPVNA